MVSYIYNCFIFLICKISFIPFINIFYYLLEVNIHNGWFKRNVTLCNALFISAVLNKMIHQIFKSQIFKLNLFRWIIQKILLFIKGYIRGIAPSWIYVFSLELMSCFKIWKSSKTTQCIETDITQTSPNWENVTVRFG